MLNLPSKSVLFGAVFGVISATGWGKLFAIGLVAGGVIYPISMAFEITAGPVTRPGGYQVMGFIFFVIMGLVLYKIGSGKSK